MSDIPRQPSSDLPRLEPRSHHGPRPAEGGPASNPGTAAPSPGDALPTPPGYPEVRCYVASPLGFTEGGRAYYIATYLPALARVVSTIDPWAAIPAEAVAQARGKGTLRELWLSAGARNLVIIRSCQLLAALLDGQEVDAGTATEVGFAAGVGVPCFGLRTDLRQAGEEGVAVNLQVEATIEASGGRVVSSLADLVDEIAAAARDLATPTVP